MLPIVNGAANKVVADSRTTNNKAGIRRVFIPPPENDPYSTVNLGLVEGRPWSLLPTTRMM
jgi:hypothetical protein